ncbi:hypothetical protein KIW84_040824 [Lathyrus oleraceus]|uniref:Reverse transcriptase domain-containing protein n=1 Tax=Pisum sativum TaxID=3888 RepID=A0A9D4XBC4_PEA|nr:hypothetical protein KIW84_040824 [Pisum sativum]
MLLVTMELGEVYGLSFLKLLRSFASCGVMLVTLMLSWVFMSTWVAIIFPDILWWISKSGLLPMIYITFSPEVLGSLDIMVERAGLTVRSDLIRLLVASNSIISQFIFMRIWILNDSCRYLILSSKLKLLKDKLKVCEIRGPLSPLLLCIAEDVLSKYTSKLVLDDHLKLFKGANSIDMPSHCFYVDDLMVHCNERQSNLTSLREAFYQYASFSFEFVNADKSTIFAGSIPHDKLHIIALYIGFIIDNLPFWHLGILIFKGKPKVAHLQHIVDKIK